MYWTLHKNINNFLNEILTLLSYTGTTSIIWRKKRREMKHRLIAVTLIAVLIYMVLGSNICCTTVQYDLTITSTAGGNVTDPGEGTFTYDEGTVVNLVAVAEAEEGYHFELSGWVGNVDTIDDVDDPTTTITMNGDYSITAEFVPVIRVGLARDLDGPLSVFECYGAGPVYRWFVDKVNDEGGIYLSDYNVTAQVELVVRDFDVAMWDIGAVTEALIDTYDCDFIWGGPGTDCIYTQAPVCNANGTLLITLEGGVSKMVWEHQNYLDQWPYVWVSSSFAEWYQIPVLAKMLEDKLAASPGTVKAYVVHVEGGYGDECLAVAEDNFEVIDSAQVPFFPALMNADEVILNAIAAQNATPYDIFCCFTYPDHAMAITSSAMALGFNPPAILFGPGANFGSFGAPPPDGFGAADVEGIMCFAVANNKTEVQVGTPTMSMAEMYNAIAAQIEDDWIDPDLPCASGNLTSGEQALDYWGTPCYVAALEMWKYAVEAAGNLDSSDARDTLVAFSPSNPAQTVFGDTWYTVFGEGFGGGVMAYECHTGEICQWQSGMVEIIGYDGINATLPNYCVTANFTYPMTDLWGWLS
jgi:hypothetical protein